MTGSNVDRLCDEYPFLSRFRSRVMDFHIRVRRWDDEFLATATGWGCSDSGTGGVHKIRFLDEKGEEVVRLCSRWRMFLSLLQPVSLVPETIRLALIQMSQEKLARVRYVVLVDVGWRQIILWKAPTGISDMAAWLELKKQVVE